MVASLRPIFNLASMDVEALFPSIDQETSARLVAEELIKQKVEYPEADVKLGTHYLLATLSKERLKREKVWHLMPRRKSEGKRGRRPTVHTKLLSGPIRREREESGEEGPGLEED